MLLAARIEDEANRLAASGHLDAAIDAYRRAIALDPARTHAQASLGIALVERGRTSEALPPLREAVERGSTEAASAECAGVRVGERGQGARGVRGAGKRPREIS